MLSDTLSAESWAEAVEEGEASVTGGEVASPLQELLNSSQDIPPCNCWPMQELQSLQELLL